LTPALIAWPFPCCAIDVNSNYLEKSARELHMPVPTMNTAHAEGPVAKHIEQQTAKLPSDWFLWAALAAIAASAALHVSDNKQASTFVGQWAPTFLILGLYNKLVKQFGSDRTSRATT
jgi:hypothetical protein